MGKTTRRYLTFLFLAGAFFGLVFSPPVLSIGLMGLMIVCVLDPRHGLNPRWRERAPDWFRRPFFWAFAALYLLLLAGAWQTYDWAYYLERLRIKLPLLLLPFAWPGFPALSPREERWVLGGFAAFVAVVLAGVLVNYALHFAEINRLLEQGRSVPVPRNHIRFSLLVGVATLVGLRGARRAAPGGAGRGWRWPDSCFWASTYWRCAVGWWGCTAGWRRCCWWTPFATGATGPWAWAWPHWSPCRWWPT